MAPSLDRGPWKVPRDWADQVAVIMASGPSMTETVARAVQASGHRSIVTNSTFRRAPFADVLYAADQEWWLHDHNKDAFEFAGLRVSVTPINSKVKWLRSTGREGLDEDPCCLRTGSNSGYQAVHLAYHFGAKKIILCGFDMHGSHWHGKHPQGLRETEKEHYALFVRRFETIAKPLADRGVDVVNCTPGSALRCFRFGDLEEELWRAH